MLQLEFATTSLLRSLQRLSNIELVEHHRQVIFFFFFDLFFFLFLNSYFLLNGHDFKNYIFFRNTKSMEKSLKIEALKT